MKLKRVIAGMLTGVMLCGAAYVGAPNTTGMKQIKGATETTKTLTKENSIRFVNKPVGQTCQQFYIDDKEEYLYATYKPVKGKKGHMLCRYKLNDDKTKATCESFMIIRNSGHGMILDGETKKGTTYIYVGCGAENDDEATGVARINYDEKDKYVYSKGKWVYSGKVDNGKVKTITPKKDKVRKINNIKLYNKDGINKLQKCDPDKKIIDFSTYLNSGEQFVKGDYCIADTGADMVYIKYKKNGTNKMRICRAADKNDKVTKDLKTMLAGYSCWQASSAWTGYDAFFTTQTSVNSLQEDNTGLYISRRKGANYQAGTTYKLNVPKGLINITGNVTNSESKNWPLEIEGIQVLPNKKEKDEKAKVYVYIRAKEEEKVKENGKEKTKVKAWREKIYYFNVSK